MTYDKNVRIKFKQRRILYDPTKDIKEVMLKKKIKFTKKFVYIDDALDYLKNELIYTDELKEVREYFKLFEVKDIGCKKKLTYSVTECDTKDDFPYKVITKYEFRIGE